MKIFRLFLAVFSTLIATSSFASAPKCTVPGSIPFFLVLGGPTELSTVPNGAIPGRFTDRFIYCLQPGADFATSRMIVTNLDKPEKTDILTGREFCNRGYISHQDEPVIGRIYVTKMDCDERVTSHNLPVVQATFMAQYKVMGSDFRSMKIEWTAPTPDRAYRLSRGGQPLDVMFLEIGGRGITKLRFHKCKHDFATCSEKLKDELTVTGEIKTLDLAKGDKIRP